MYKAMELDLTIFLTAPVALTIDSVESILHRLPPNIKLRTECFKRLLENASQRIIAQFITDGDELVQILETRRLHSFPPES